MVVRYTTTVGGVGVPQPPNKKHKLSRKTSCPNDYLVNSLFRRYSHESEQATAGLRPVSIPDDLSVFHEVRQSRTVVDGKYPSWPAHLKQLAVGLLAIYRHRKVDFSIREEVMLLHIAETSYRMRAQQGQCWVYKDGAMVLFPGIVSQGTLQRVRCFMKQLEGILKFLPDQREFPSEEALLEHINQVFVRLCLPGQPVGDGQLERITTQLQTKAHYPSKLTSWPVQLQRISKMHIGKGYDSSVV